MQELSYYPLKGKPYFDNDKKWVSPMNFLPEAMEGFPESIYIYDVTLARRGTDSGSYFQGG